MKSPGYKLASEITFAIIQCVLKFLDETSSISTHQNFESVIRDFKTFDEVARYMLASKIAFAVIRCVPKFLNNTFSIRTHQNFESIILVCKIQIRLAEYLSTSRAALLLSDAF